MRLRGPHTGKFRSSTTWERQVVRDGVAVVEVRDLPHLVPLDGGWDGVHGAEMLRVHSEPSDGVPGRLGPLEHAMEAIGLVILERAAWVRGWWQR